MRGLRHYDGTMLTISDLSRSPLLHLVCVTGDLVTLQCYVEAALMRIYGPRSEFGVVIQTRNNGRGK